MTTMLSSRSVCQGVLGISHHPGPWACAHPTEDALEKWSSFFLMLRPFNTVPHAVVTPNYEILLLLHNSNFDTVMNHNKIPVLSFVLGQTLWKGHSTLPQRGHYSQVENHWSSDCSMIDKGGSRRMSGRFCQSRLVRMLVLEVLQYDWVCPKWKLSLSHHDNVR